MLKILALPESSNPYQSMLYSPLKDRLHISYGFWKLHIAYTYPVVLTVKRLQGYRILHLHWTYWLTTKLPAKNLQYLCTKLNIYLFLLISQLLGYKLVRTMHNLLPHEQQTTNDLKTARVIAAHCDATVVHSSNTLTEMDRLKIKSSNCKIIPIGSYDGIYPDNISRVQARKKLGIGPAEFVILFFGIIRPYKGVNDLLRATRTADLAKSRIIIAGLCDDANTLEQIKRLSAGQNVTFYNQFIDDSQVAAFFKASDVVCLPFKKITTSSSVLLAMAFTTTVIAPLIGALKDVPAQTGIYYEQSQDGLVQALQKASQNHHLCKTVAEAGKKYSESLSWSNISEETYRLFQEVAKR